MDLDLSSAALENCIYCGACFRYCVLGAYNELDGMELKALVAGVTRIARKGYRPEKDGRIKELLDRCTLQGYCNKVCPAMVNPLVRNRVAKKRIEEER
ncbi:MAG: 4Fe-4S dicluster domain-containing protein [Methanobacteriota archaeon]|nr:MAG: 4Fe-4S dicluster domain-containing protein [Euryarchaeota archaeon]